MFSILNKYVCNTQFKNEIIALLSMYLPTSSRALQVQYIGIGMFVSSAFPQC